jgi:glycosyltransferase involved in cell wall biosynthesis
VSNGAAPETRSVDSRLRVLSLARDAGRGMGGAESLAYEFVHRLDPDRFKRYLCTTRRPEAIFLERAAEDERELERSGVEVLRLDRRSSWSVLPWRRLYQHLAAERIDVVHAHMPRASVPGSILARLARVPVVVSHEHGSWLDGKRVRPFLDRNVVARLSTTMLAVSEWDRRQLIECEGIPPARIRVLPNGIAPPAEGGRAELAELGVPPGGAVIGAVGRLFEVKGYDYLIRAVALLKARGRTVRCVLLGEGPEEQRLKRLIADLGVGQEVRLIGRRQNVAEIVRALDVAVLPSRAEGSPLVVLEYMAVGAPIVATAVGGVPELIDDGVHGLLIPPRDPDALAQAIDRLLDDRALAARLGAAAQERQRAEHDLDMVVSRLEHMYLSLARDSRVVTAGPVAVRSGSEGG